MKNKLHNKGVESACASTAAVKSESKKSNDVYAGWVPFAIHECKLLRKGSMSMPCYKVSFWGEDTTIWFCGVRLSYQKGQKYEDVLRNCDSFIHGGAIQLRQMITPYNSEEERRQLEKSHNRRWREIIENNEHDISFNLWRWQEIKSIVFEEPVYAGVDVWNTDEGLQFSVSGSTWLIDYSETGKFGLLIDGFMIEELHFMNIA